MGGMGAVYALGWPVTAVVRWRVSKASPSFAMIFLKRDVYAAPLFESMPDLECASVYLKNKD